MAISIFKTPKNYEAGYVPFLPFGLTSSVSGENNHRFVLDLYTSKNWEGFDLSNWNFTTRVSFPARQNGNGIYSPTKILQSLFEPKFNNKFGADPFILISEINPIQDLDEAFTAYSFRYFDQFNPNYFYNGIIPGGQLGVPTASTDLYFNPGTTYSNPDTLVEIDIQEGDIITIQKQNSLSQPSLIGTSSVTNVSTASGSKVVRIDRDNSSIPYTQTADESGFVVNILREDNTINSATQGVGFYGVNNMVYQYDEYEEDKIEDYICGTSSVGKFMSVYPEEKPVYLDNFETLDFTLGLTYSGKDITTNNWYDIFTNNAIIVNTYNSSNTLLTTTTYSGNQFLLESTPRKFIPSGPSNLGITSSTVSKYDIVVKASIGGSFLPITETKTYSIIPDSCREFDVVRLQFKNKLGGYDYFNFDLVSKYTRKIERTTMRKKLDYDYNISDRGEQVIADNIEEVWEINSNWLNDDQAIFISELIESPEVYLVVQNGNAPLNSSTRTGNYKLPIIITNDSYEYKSKINDEVIQYKIEFVKAYKIENNS